MLEQFSPAFPHQRNALNASRNRLDFKSSYVGITSWHHQDPLRHRNLWPLWLQPNRPGEHSFMSRGVFASFHLNLDAKLLILIGARLSWLWRGVLCVPTAAAGRPRCSWWWSRWLQWQWRWLWPQWQWWQWCTDRGPAGGWVPLGVLRHHWGRNSALPTNIDFVDTCHHLRLIAFSYFCTFIDFAFCANK